MSTDTQKPDQNSINTLTQTLQNAPYGAPVSNLAPLIQVMGKVDTSSPNAQQNSVSISDGKGGRITLNDKTPGMRGKA